jgi:hypothetical protein
MAQKLNTTPESTAAITQMSDLEKGGHKKGKTSNNVRTGDKSNEEIILPKNRLVIVFIGLMLTVFLAALDMTIVCTFQRLLRLTSSHGTADHCEGFKRRR